MLCSGTLGSSVGFRNRTASVKTVPDGAFFIHFVQNQRIPGREAVNVQAAEILVAQQGERRLVRLPLLPKYLVGGWVKDFMLAYTLRLGCRRV